VRELKALVGPKPPQGVWVRVHARLGINKLSKTRGGTFSESDSQTDSQISKGGYRMVLDEEGGVVVGERVSKLLGFARVRVAVHSMILLQCLRVQCSDNTTPCEMTGVTLHTGLYSHKCLGLSRVFPNCFVSRACV
jgi:hypothetical protein